MANALSTPYQFAGMRADLVTGMDLTESRPYMPTVGRFPMADSYIAKPGDLHNSNLYLYAAGQATDLSDPTGHLTALETLGVMTLIVGISAIHFFSTSEAISYFGRSLVQIAPPTSPRDAYMTPPAWALPKPGVPGPGAGVNPYNDPNCQMTAFNRSLGSPTLPAMAMLDLSDADAVRNTMDFAFDHNTYGVRGYPIVEGGGQSGTVPAGWHAVALYVVVPNTWNYAFIESQISFVPFHDRGVDSRKLRKRS